MRDLERAVEWLRPLVETKGWDYCVVWKLGDDPSRFIEWMGGCCAGCYGHNFNLKKESGEEQHSLNLCKDFHIQHPIRTKACEALALLPSSMPLYSGIHGEVVLSTQPIWFGHGKHDTTGTQVFIPVVDGLIELFSAKHIAKDQKIIEFVKDQYKHCSGQEVMTAQSNNSVTINEQPPLDPLLNKNLNNSPVALDNLKFIPRLQLLPPIAHPITYPHLDGSGSIPTHDHLLFSSGSIHIPQRVSLFESIGKYPGSKNPNCRENLSKKREIHFILGHANHVVEEHNLKPKQRTERDQYQSKNLDAERNRRNRIKDGLFTLRALVPKISKMDRASILGDAAEYIEELQHMVKALHDELKEMEDEECNKNNVEEKMPKANEVHDGNKNSPCNEHNQESSTADEKKQTEVQLEVNQIGTKDFLLKFTCKQKRGIFARLMEAMNSLGFQVLDANVTTINGKVLNILRVEANKTEVQPKSLKDSLIRLTSQTCQTVDGSL
ncbi:transcription factor bHLH90 [Cornus florida]|uniref:transcription factor bHLH90 n=1 Tax=Cornus florida TaxID=4283 RepID=UPI0028969D8F|nr:transcription factor bHLH90 [Cornus florida]